MKTEKSIPIFKLLRFISIITCFCIVSACFLLLNDGQNKRLIQSRRFSSASTRAREPASLLSLLNSIGKRSESCLPYNFEGAHQEDPVFIDYIRRNLLVPPSPLKYNLEHPETLHFSQSNQSQYAYKYYLKGLKDGFFVEVGALNGELLSNSLFFEREMGWRGLLIEPNIETYNSLLTKNRKAYSINAALSPTDRASMRTLTPYGHMGHLGELTSSLIGFKVKTIPFYSILAALNVEVVDFLSLDIESFEVKILQTIPWDKVKFRLMCIESVHIPEGNYYLIQFLISKGYLFLGQTKHDSWFGWPDLLEELKLPEGFNRSLKPFFI